MHPSEKRMGEAIPDLPRSQSNLGEQSSLPNLAESILMLKRLKTFLLLICMVVAMLFSIPSQVGLRAQDSCSYWQNVYNVADYLYDYYMWHYFWTLDEYWLDQANIQLVRMGNAGNYLDQNCN